MHIGARSCTRSLQALLERGVVLEEDQHHIEQGERAHKGIPEGEEGKGVDEQHEVPELVEPQAVDEEVVHREREDDRDDEDRVELHGGLLGRGSPKFSPRCTRPRWRGRWQ